MDLILLINILSRWVHVLTAIVMLGGAIYLRWVLMPAAAELPALEHEGLRARLKQRWKFVVMIGIVLLLATGFYNYLAIAVPSHEGRSLSRYHMLMGIKILLALGVFFLASVLTGRSAKFEPMRQNARRWLTVLVLLSAIVVGIGSVLKVAVPPNLGPITPTMTP